MTNDSMKEKKWKDETIKIKEKYFYVRLLQIRACSHINMP